MNGTKNKKVSEIGLICIYTLPATHSRRSIVITRMFSGICGVSICSFLVIWIWSWNLFTYFIASLRHDCRRSCFCRFLMLLNMNISFALMTVFHVILIGSAHNSTIVFYFGRLVWDTVICGLINVVGRMQSTLETIGILSISRL